MCIRDSIGREGQQSGMCRLSELGELDADMFTTVFVGNAGTKMCIRDRRDIWSDMVFPFLGLPVPRRQLLVGTSERKAHPLSLIHI